MPLARRKDWMSEKEREFMPPVGLASGGGTFAQQLDEVCSSSTFQELSELNGSFPVDVQEQYIQKQAPVLTLSLDHHDTSLDPESLLDSVMVGERAASWRDSSSSSSSLDSVSTTSGLSGLSWKIRRSRGVYICPRQNGDQDFAMSRVEAYSPF